MRLSQHTWGHRFNIAGWIEIALFFILLAACLLPSSMSASAQTTPHEVKNAPTAGQRGGSDDGQRTLIATVFGEPLYLEQVTLAGVETKRKELPPSQFDEWLSSHRGRRLYQIIWGEVYSRLREREQIHVTDDESAAIAQVIELRLKTEEQPPPGSPFEASSVRS
jgi:hypothetical protein